MGPCRFSPLYNKSKPKKIEGLAKRGVFKIVAKEDVPLHTYILGCRMVLSFKENKNNEKVYDASLVVLGHKDMKKGTLVNNSSDLKQSSIRILLSLEAIFGLPVSSQDLFQAYLQASEQLKRDIHIRSTDEFKLSKDDPLKTVKPLHGLCNSGDHRRATLLRQFNEDLNITPVVFDAALFFKTLNGEYMGMMDAYDDGTIAQGASGFTDFSKATENLFESKP